MDNLKIEKVSVALSPVEREIIDRKSKKHGLHNFSSALRMIVREWDETQKNGNGHAQPIAPAAVAEVNEEEKQ